MLRDAEVPFMITGSLASSHYGAPRATQDVDFVVELTPARARDLVRRFLSAGYYVSEEAAIEAVDVDGQFNVIDASSGWKLDLICRKARSFSRMEFDRRRSATVLEVDTAMVSPEDLVVAKLEWAKASDSELQLRDVVAVMQAQGETLDHSYIERWVEELGLDAQWRRVKAAAGPGEGF
jgi:hypothetical protein